MTGIGDSKPRARHGDRRLTCDVRPASLGDIQGIQAVARASWRRAYRDIFPARTIDAFLADAYAAARLAAALAHRQSTLLVAVGEGRTLAFCQFGDRGGGPELFRLYVCPERWNRGIGRRLLTHTEMQLTVCGVRRYFLTVHRRNRRGIQFYARQGFLRAPAHDRGALWCMTKALCASPSGPSERAGR